MANNHNFKVKNGLEVGKEAHITGKLTINGDSAPDFGDLTLNGSNPAIYFADNNGSSAWHFGQNGTDLYILEDPDRDGLYENIRSYWRGNLFRHEGNITASGTITAGSFSGSLNYNDITNPPVIDNSVDYINAASFNTGTGVLTLSGVGRAGATVDLDGRYYNTTDSDNRYVRKTGDTMTGNLSIHSSSPVLILKDTTGTDAAQTGFISLKDNANVEKGWMGYGSTGNTDLTIRNSQGRVRLDGSHTYIPGLDLAISSSNSDHGAGTYFRGSNSHFVLGLSAGNTLYLNYGNSAGNLRLYGNIYYENTLTLNSARDLLSLRNATFSGTVTANNFVGSIDYSQITNPPVIDNSVDYINSASFNTSNGVLTLSGVGRAGATVDLDNRYKLLDDTYRWELNDVSNISGSRWYKVATVNTGNGGLRIEGVFSNHVESFGTQKVDLSIFGREGGLNTEVEIAGSIDVGATESNTGILVLKADDSSVYHTFDVYVAVSRYAMVQLDFTKTGIINLWLPSVSNYVTTKPTGISTEFDGTNLSEGSYTVVDSQLNDNYHSGNLNPVTGLTHDTVNTELDITFADGTTQSLDLSQYIDDTNLARILSGSHVGSGIVRFTRDDSTTFDVDLSDFFDDTNLSRIVSASWNTSNGVLTLTRNDSTTVTVDLDGRYYNTGESDGRYVRKTGDTMTGTLTIEDSVLEVGNKSEDNYVEISQFSGASDFGFTFQHSNASLFRNLQGGTNQVLALGDVDSTGNATLLGVSILQSGTYYNRLDLRGNGSMYIGSGTDRVFADNYHPNADKWTTARTHTVTLTGEVTGTASQSVDGTGNRTWTISTTLNNDALNDQYVQQLSDTSSPDYQTPSSRRVDPNTSNPTNEHYAVMTYGNGGNVTGQLATHFQNGATYNRAYNNSWSAWSRMFDDDYHPNADKWTTARTNTVTLTGDATGSGSASVDGTGNWTVSVPVTVANDSHNHTYFSVSGITNLDAIPNASSTRFRPFVSNFQATNRSGSNYNGGFEIGTGASNYSAQLVFEASGQTTAPRFRNKISGTWGSWYALWSTADFNIADYDTRTVSDSRYVRVTGDTMTGQLTVPDIKLNSGSVAVSSDDSCLTLNGNYADGRWSHRFRKQDLGGGVPLFLDITQTTANAHTALARFGSYSGNSFEFELFGDAKINGLLTATQKSFTIDHPTKEGYKLRYGSLEGPENGVYVRGRLKGTNTIELPEYWKELVHEDSITVNLTPIGKGQDIWVEDFNTTEVVVGGENVNCFYTVYGERKDVDKLITEFKEVE